MKQKKLRTERNSEYFHSMRLNYNGGFFAIPSATVEILCGDDKKAKKAAKVGVGPIDACFKAIMKVTKTNHRLLRYDSAGVNGGTEAPARSVVQLLAHGELFEGVATHSDVVASAALSYLSALNRIKEWELAQENIEK